MPQTITDFYRVSQERDFSRDFQFRVLNIQPGGGSAVSFDEDDLVYIKGGQIPTRQIFVGTVPYMGLDFRVPGAAKYSGEFTANFWCDAQSKVRKLMEDWSVQIFDDATSTGDYFVPRETSVVDLQQIDPQFNEVSRYQLIGCFPSNVGDINYTIGGNGEAVEFEVTLSYHFWRRLK